MAKKILRNTANGERVYNKDAVDVMQAANKEYSDSIIGCYAVPDWSHPVPAYGGTKTVNLAAAGTKAHIFTAMRTGNYTVWVNPITPNISMIYSVNDSTVADNDFYMATLATGYYATLNINLKEGDAIYVKTVANYTSSAKFTWHYRPLVPVTE